MTLLRQDAMKYDVTACRSHPISVMWSDSLLREIRHCVDKAAPRDMFRSEGIPYEFRIFGLRGTWHAAKLV